MQRLIDLEQYGRLTAAAAQKGAKNQNAHLMPEEVKHLTGRGALWYDEIPQGVLFWQPNGAYTLLSLFVDPQSEFTIPPTDIPAVVGFLGAGSIPKRLLPVAERLKACGFVQGERGKRMSIATEALCTSLSYNGSWEVGLAEMRHKDEILRLWTDTFDPVANLIPSAEELAEQIEAGSILRACTPQDDTAGVMLADHAGGCGWIRHQAVEPSFRGKGVGTALSARFAEIMREKGAGRCCLWVKENDPLAIRFHSKTGFVFDGKIYEPYISPAQQPLF